MQPIMLVYILIGLALLFLALWAVIKTGGSHAVV
jgi:hypothetical protein